MVLCPFVIWHWPNAQKPCWMSVQKWQNQCFYKNIHLTAHSMPALESSSLHSTIFRKSQVLVFTPQSSHLLLISLKIMQTTVTLLCQAQKGKTAYLQLLHVSVQCLSKPIQKNKNHTTITNTHVFKGLNVDILDQVFGWLQIPPMCRKTMYIFRMLLRSLKELPWFLEDKLTLLLQISEQHNHQKTALVEQRVNSCS